MSTEKPVEGEHKVRIGQCVDEINASVRAALSELSGGSQSSVALLSGLSDDELDDVGGLPG